jgi:hypothetical protein
VAPLPRPLLPPTAVGFACCLVGELGWGYWSALADDFRTLVTLRRLEATARLQNQLQGKAKGDGEDVLTPLLK